MAEARAIQRTTRQSPYKMRLVIDLIRGLESRGHAVEVHDALAASGPLPARTWGERNTSAICHPLAAAVPIDLDLDQRERIVDRARPVPRLPEGHHAIGREHGPRGLADVAARVGGAGHAGFEPEALVSFLALLGWSPGGDREIVPEDEMIALFDRIEREADETNGNSPDEGTAADADATSRRRCKASRRSRPSLPRQARYRPSSASARRARSLTRASSR